VIFFIKIEPFKTIGGPNLNIFKELND